MIGVLGAACNDSSSPSTTLVCTSPVPVTATAGTNPKVDWSPKCRINGLSIITANPNQSPFLYWGISFPVDSNPLLPPLVYGQTVPGATVFGGNMAFPPGDSVRVTLLVSNSTTPDTLVEVGATVIVPTP